MDFTWNSPMQACTTVEIRKRVVFTNVTCSIKTQTMLSDKNIEIETHLSCPESMNNNKIFEVRN